MAKRWKGEAGCDTAAIVIFSPYLTSKTAETVLANIKGGNATICTLFSSEVFASGASSLTTLKKLAKSGHILLYLDDLHAKVFLVPGKFASLGSQNLTHGGTRRKEAGIALQDSKSVATVEREAVKWLDNAKPITAEMILDMQKELAPLVLQFRTARRAAMELDRQIRDQQVERTQESRRRLQLLQQTLDESVLPGSQLDAEVRQVASSYWTFIHSLVASDGRHLTNWKIGNEFVRMPPKFRYLCVIRDTGQLGWVRLMKTRITFVEQALSRSQPIMLGENRYRLTLKADWGPRLRDDRNVTITVSGLDGTKLCVVSCFLSIISLNLTHVQQLHPRSPRAATAAEECSNQIKSSPLEFTSLCMRELITPFVYQNRLTGTHADQFFGPVGTKVTLSIATVQNQRVIVVT